MSRKCEGCGDAATKEDTDGVPLCNLCYMELQIETYKRELSALRGEVERVKGAFKEYGRHKRGCQIVPADPLMGTLGLKPHSCTCGFNEALSRPEQEHENGDRKC
jgi:hypothetical protein